MLKVRAVKWSRETAPYLHLCPLLFLLQVPLSDDEYPEDEEDAEQDKSGVAETAATNETATAGPVDAVANEGDAAVAANDGPAADKAVDSPTAAVIEGPLEATSKPPKKAVGSQISKDRSLPTKVRNLLFVTNYT